MKERVEDLGRLREKLDHLIDSEIFESINMHDEVFIEKFKDEDQIDTLRLQLKFVEEQLYDCYVIARGDEE